MRGAREAATGGRRRDPGEQFPLLPPEMAEVIARAGWILGQAAAFLWREGGGDWPIARAAEDVHFILTGGAGVKMTCLVPRGGGTWCVMRGVRGESGAREAWRDTGIGPSTSVRQDRANMNHGRPRRCDSERELPC